jgi:hypothetical protein
MFTHWIDDGAQMKIIRSLSLAVFLALQLVYAHVPGETVQPQPSAFEQKLREVRYDLRLEDGRFVGNAAPVLESAIANAQYVLIGEDHITREIPQFTTAVCDIMAPQGLSAMAVEVGPQVAEFVSSSFGKPNRLARMAALTQQYPDSVAFLNVLQENDLAALARKSLIPLISVFGVLIRSSLAQRAGCWTRLWPRIPARRQPPLSRD